MSIIDSQEFEARRQRLLKSLDLESLLIVAAGPVCLRNNDIEYAYRQDSDFYYLTGFAEPEAVAVFAPGGVMGDYVLFVREKDLQAEKWAGARAGLQGACEVYGADTAFALQDLAKKLPALLNGRRTVYYPYGRYAFLDREVKEAIQTVRYKTRAPKKVPETIMPIDSLLHEMRLLKSPAEIATMRRAAEISAAAHQRAMRVCKPGLYEYALEAEFIYEFTKHGCKAPAYNTIVGGGANACVLHYVENNQLLENDQLVLIDAGAEYDYYAADITRTFPINGCFNAEQRVLYEIVLNAQTAAIAEIKPGLRFDKLQTKVIEVLTEGLIECGLLKGQRDSLIAHKAYQDFYFHNCSHWLGMDVHDVGGNYKNGQVRCLEPNMVLTIEPGLYIAPDNMHVAPQWRGIGIRIEDDIVVTAEGYEILSAAAPKTIAQIETLMAE